MAYAGWDVTFGEVPSATKWNILGTNDETFDTALRDGWNLIDDSWTYASANTITVPSDATTLYRAGDWIRFKQGAGFKHMIIDLVAATLLTVKDGIDGATTTVANSAITDIWFSKAPRPLGVPLAASWLDRVRVAKSGDQSINDSSETSVTWNTDEYDTNNMHDTSSNTERLVATRAGLYQAIANINFDNDADNARVRSVTIYDASGNAIGGNAGVQSDNDSFDTIVSASAIIPLAAGGWVRCAVFHDAGAALNINAARSSFSLHQIS